MHRDLDPLHGQEEREQVPGGEDVQMHLDLQHPAQTAASIIWRASIIMGEKRS